MKTQFGQLVTGDFQEKTMVIEIEGDMELVAGKVAVVPVEEYKKLKQEGLEYSKLYESVVAEIDEQDNNGEDDVDEIGRIVCSHFGLD